MSDSTSPAISSSSSSSASSTPCLCFPRVGLLNQGATCYLNSLLQGLYYTPAFRTLLLQHWSYTESQHGSKELCIPLQLQLLFARLTLSKERRYVETNALTKSFRWTHAEAFKVRNCQHTKRSNRQCTIVISYFHLCMRQPFSHRLFLCFWVMNCDCLSCSFCLQSYLLVTAT